MDDVVNIDSQHGKREVIRAPAENEQTEGRKEGKKEGFF